MRIYRTRADQEADLQGCVELWEQEAERASLKGDTKQQRFAEECADRFASMKVKGVD